MRNPTNGGRHRRRWTATGLVLGVPAILVPYLLFAQEDSQAATVDGDAYYRLVSVRSGKVLEVDGYSTADGTRIQLYTCNSGANQQWTVDGTTLRALGKCMDVANGGTADGGAVQLGTCNGATSQNWSAGANGSVVNTKSGKCLDANGAGTANGTVLIIWTCHGGNNQRWTLP